MINKNLILLALIFVLFSCGQLENDSRSAQPNIILILADDQRYNTINALNSPEIITPNLDKLVNTGTSFTNTYIMGGNSGAVCKPSRAMLLSGRHLFAIDEQGSDIPQDHKLIGEHLRENGYVTFATGKWHNGKDAYRRSFTFGDEIFFGGMSDHWNVPLFHFDSTGKYNPALPYIENPYWSNEVQYYNADHFRHGEHSSKIFTDAVLSFLNQRKEDKPFYAYLSFTAPHDPRSMPFEYLEMYDTANISLPENFMPEHPFDNGELKIRDEKLAGFPRKPEEVKIHIRDYYAMITHLDAQIGRIISTLEENDELDNTIIIFTGDNGLAVGQHGLMGKQNLYEHSLKVPLIITGPGIPSAELREQMVYLWDIFPTVNERLNIDTPGSIKGKSFAAAIQDKEYIHRDNMLFAYRHLQRAVRQGDFKLIAYQVENEKTVQLFNLKDDPNELNNLAMDSTYNDTLTKMINLLKDQQKVYQDTVKIL